MATLAARHDRRSTTLSWTLAGVAGVGAIGTAVTVLAPATRLALPSESTRVALEVAGLCALLFAAAVISVTSDDDARPSRTPFVCALVVLALANAAFAIWPAVVQDRFAVDRGLALYPWMAARYLAGGLLLLAAADRAAVPLARALMWSVGGLVLIEALLIASGPALPVPVVLGADGMTVTVVDPIAHVLLQAAPTAMFAVGSILAARLHHRIGGPGPYWLAIALLTLSFAQVHEILFPAMLGPVVTTADVLRAVAFALLTVGASAQVRRLYLLRTRVVAVQQQDIDHRSALVDELAAFTDTEETFRQLVTHELATPLAAIRAHGQILARTLDGPQPPAVEAALASLDAESTRLLSLLQRLDELRDLDAAQLRCDLRPVRIKPLLAEVCRFAEALPGGHRTVLATHDLRVQADPVRLGQLLRNVLANAVRYAPAHAPIEVRTEVEGRALRITVTDDGPGIPEAERDAVLERSARGSTASGSVGDGLGLYLAQQIAIGHGDRIRLADGPAGRGTSVSVALQLT